MCCYGNVNQEQNFEIVGVLGGFLFEHLCVQKQVLQMHKCSILLFLTNNFDMQFGNMWQLLIGFKIINSNFKHFARDLDLGHNDLAHCNTKYV